MEDVSPTVCFLIVIIIDLFMILLVKFCKRRTQENNQVNSMELIASGVNDQSINRINTQEILIQQLNQTNDLSKSSDQLSVADLPTYDEYIKKISNANSN